MVGIIKKTTGYLSVIRKFCALLRIYAIETLHYRAEIIFYLIGGTQPLVMMFIWITINNSGQLQSSYSSSYFICYFLLIYTVRNLNVMWFFLLDQHIREGKLSIRLLRPIHPFWDYLAFYLADVLLRIPLILPFIVTGLVMTDAYTLISIQGLGVAIIAVLSGMTIHYLANLLMGISAFWIERAIALNTLYFTLLTLAGGAILPLEFFPDILQQIFLLSPFPYILSFPVEIAMGRLSATEIIQGFLVQFLWVIILTMAVKYLWGGGISKYSSAGA